MLQYIKNIIYTICAIKGMTVLSTNKGVVPKTLSTTTITNHTIKHLPPCLARVSNSGAAQSNELDLAVCLVYF